MLDYECAVRLYLIKHLTDLIQFSKFRHYPLAESFPLSVPFQQHFCFKMTPTYAVFNVFQPLLSFLILENCPAHAVLSKCPLLKISNPESNLVQNLPNQQDRDSPILAKPARNHGSTHLFLALALRDRHSITQP